MILYSLWTEKNNYLNKHNYSINYSYLRPHIDELLKFLDGVVMMENKVPTLYKIALIGSSSDVPASRKFNGFMAHNANKGKQDFRSKPK